MVAGYKFNQQKLITCLYPISKLGNEILQKQPFIIAPKNIKNLAINQQYILEF